MRIRKFKIQNLIMSFSGLLEEHHAMMYRGAPYNYDKLHSYYRWNAGDFAEFFTYFNSFSLGKWSKYTNAKNVYLQLRCMGRFKIRLFGHYRVGAEVCKEMYEEVYYNLPEMTDIKLPVPKESGGEVIGFQFDVLRPATKKHTDEDDEDDELEYDIDEIADETATDDEDEEAAHEKDDDSSETKETDTDKDSVKNSTVKSKKKLKSKAHSLKSKAKTTSKTVKKASADYDDDEDEEDDPDSYFMCIESGGWYTDIEEELINDVRISIATTTFKNEKYIKRNIDVLEREIFYGSEEIRDHIKMVVIDNGRTLVPDDINSEYIRVIPNENVGGAGGFTRGMLESTDDSGFSPTHVLLMDDDVTMMPESFIRTYSLLSLLKPAYKDRFVSGAMLYFERMNFQHEDVGFVHEDGSYGPNKKVMDMEIWKNVYENDEDIPFQKNSYAGWWYCCIPVQKIKKEHLPVPLFIRGDDVEFSLANKAEFLTLNGICIWHKGFTSKFNANLELYMVHRNSLIIQAMSGICDGVDFVARIEKFFVSNMCRLAYNNCELLLDAVEEYCKGPEFMLTPQGERIMKEHSAKDEKMVPAHYIYKEEIDYDSIYKPSEKYEIIEVDGWKQTDGANWGHTDSGKTIKMNVREEKLTDKELNFYYKTFNGQTLSERKQKKLLQNKVAVIAYDWYDEPAKQYMAKEILAVNPYDKTAILRKRDSKRFSELMQRHDRVMAYYKANKKSIANSYKQASEKLQSEAFWRDYLKMKGR